MEVIEDGNIMDRIPILLQRDIEYYEKNHTVLSESVCRGVVGGRLDFPRNASFAAVKIVLWLEEEFSIAFKQGSGMFVTIEDDDSGEGGVAKTSDPDKFVQLAVKSADLLLEHLHMLAQEALDHADLPVLTSTLGAAALLKNSLYCYLQHTEEMGSSERHNTLQSCYKRYVTMFEAVGERVLDLHSRVVSLYVLQDAGGRAARAAHAPEHGAPSVQGWWLYMNGSRKDLWDTVPPRMAQRIFAGMLNETLTILTVRYCQTNTTEATTPILINDILNILLCVAQLLPSICSNGLDLAGLDVKQQTRDVRDVHAKCNELFKCLVYRGAELHFIHQAFKQQQPSPLPPDAPCPWLRLVSPQLFDALDDVSAGELPLKTAIGLELVVLLAQPQPSWASLVKVIMMRNCHLARLLLVEAIRNMSVDNSKWPANGLWYNVDGKQTRCEGFLCTADGYCNFKGDDNAAEQYARAAGALSLLVATVGSRAELASTLAYALELSGRDWAACLDKRQVWCDRRPSWLAALLGLAGGALHHVPPALVRARLHTASMYQTMSLCLTCISRSLPCIPRSLFTAADVIQSALPSHVHPVGGSVLLQALLTVVYEEIIKWAHSEAAKEKAAASETNGDSQHSDASKVRTKHVRIAGFGQSNTSLSFDSHGQPSSMALAIAEALCSIDEDDKHTREIEQLVALSKKTFTISDKFGLEDFPEFAEFCEEGTVAGSRAESGAAAAALTSAALMAPPARDSLRVIYEHLQLHAEKIYKELGVQPAGDVDAVPLHRAPLLYIMFHIGRWPFDQYLRKEWPMPWSKLVSVARSWSGAEGARAHVRRRAELRAARAHTHAGNKLLADLYDLFNTPATGLL